MTMHPILAILAGAVWGLIGGTIWTFGIRPLLGDLRQHWRFHREGAAAVDEDDPLLAHASELAEWDADLQRTIDSRHWREQCVEREALLDRLRNDPEPTVVVHDNRFIGALSGLLSASQQERQTYSPEEYLARQMREQQQAPVLTRERRLALLAQMQSQGLFGFPGGRHPFA